MFFLRKYIFLLGSLLMSAALLGVDPSDVSNKPDEDPRISRFNELVRLVVGNPTAHNIEALRKELRKSVYERLRCGIGQYQLAFGRAWHACDLGRQFRLTLRLGLDLRGLIIDLEKCGLLYDLNVLDVLANGNIHEWIPVFEKLYPDWAINVWNIRSLFRNHQVSAEQIFKAIFLYYARDAACNILQEAKDIRMADLLAQALFKADVANFLRSESSDELHGAILYKMLKGWDHWALSISDEDFLKFIEWLIANGADVHYSREYVYPEFTYWGHILEALAVMENKALAKKVLELLCRQHRPLTFSILPLTFLILLKRGLMDYLSDEDYMMHLLHALKPASYWHVGSIHHIMPEARQPNPGLSTTKMIDWIVKPAIRKGWLHILQFFINNQWLLIDVELGGVLIGIAEENHQQEIVQYLQGMIGIRHEVAIQEVPLEVVVETAPVENEAQEAETPEEVIVVEEVAAPQALVTPLQDLRQAGDGASMRGVCLFGKML